MSAVKNDRNDLRQAVDTVFRQTSPSTPTRIVQNVLTSEESNSNDNNSTDREPIGTSTTDAPLLPFAEPVMRRDESAAPLSRSVQQSATDKTLPLQLPTADKDVEMSFALPLPDVAPIAIDNNTVAQTANDAKQKSGEGAASSQSNTMFWTVFLAIIGLVTAAFLLCKFSTICEWIDEQLRPVSSAQIVGVDIVSGSTAVPLPPNDAAAVHAVKPSALERSTDVAAPASMIRTKALPIMPGAKKVQFDESKNTVQFIDDNRTASTPSSKVAAKPATALATMLDDTPNDTPNDSDDGGAALLQKLEISLDNLQKTSADLQRKRDEAVALTSQKEQGALLRLDERNQFSRSECLATLPMEETQRSAQAIYDKYGGNSVVGNRNQAPFLTFAPGEEPIDGMVPDYDERVHGDGDGTMPSQPPPLKAGQPHSIMALVSDHCMRTGKPMPKTAEQSTLDVRCKQDASSHAPMKTADYDGHYLQSQKKQFELLRMNRGAIKKIYEAKHASATGQILDRGGTALSSFAGAQGDDAVQFLNVNSL